MTATHVGKTQVRTPSFLRNVVFDAGSFAVLAFLSFVVGCLSNRLRSAPFPLDYQSKASRLATVVKHVKAEHAPIATESASQLREITLDEFQDFVNSQKGLIIDARTSGFFRQAHVPRAVNVSREDFDVDYAREQTRLMARKNQPIAVYCSEADCQDSTLVASALADLGYPSILIYREGWAEWAQAGLPQEPAR